MLDVFDVFGLCSLLVGVARKTGSLSIPYQGLESLLFFSGFPSIRLRLGKVPHLLGLHTVKTGVASAIVLCFGFFTCVFGFPVSFLVYPLLPIGLLKAHHDTHDPFCALRLFWGIGAGKMRPLSRNNIHRQKV